LVSPFVFILSSYHQDSVSSLLSSSWGKAISQVGKMRNEFGGLTSSHKVASREVLGCQRQVLTPLTALEVYQALALPVQDN